MLDREVFSCIPFQLVFCPKSACPCLLRETTFPCFAKNFFWNWSLNSAVKILLPRTISFVYRLYLFCNICQKYFLTVSSSTDLFKPIQLVFCFYRMYVTAYLLCTHRIVTFCYVDVQKHVRKSEAVWSTAGNCDAECWTNLSRAFMMLLQMSS